jgi:hypothetical protein
LDLITLIISGEEYKLRSFTLGNFFILSQALHKWLLNRIDTGLALQDTKLKAILGTYGIKTGASNALKLRMKVREFSIMNATKMGCYDANGTMSCCTGDEYTSL